MPLASARQRPKTKKENQAGHSSERAVEGKRANKARPAVGSHRATNKPTPEFTTFHILLNQAIHTKKTEDLDQDTPPVGPCFRRNFILCGYGRD